MVFKVPASKASIKQNLFEFEVPGSKKKWSLPKMQYLSADEGSALSEIAMASIDLDTGKPRAEVDPALALRAAQVQRSVFEKYCPGLYALVDGEQLEALVTAWQEASTVGLGE